MRLIDADELKRNVLKWMSKDQSDPMDSAIPPLENLTVSMVMEINDAPTVDAVPVVRCKNCIHWGKYPVSTVLPHYHKCGMATYKSTKGDDFCSIGELEDGDNHDTV